MVAGTEAVLIPGVWQMGLGSGLAARKSGCEAGHGAPALSPASSELVEW